MTTLLESLEAKAQADDVCEITLEELIAWWGSRKYSPVGQATLNHLERLQRLQSADQPKREITSFGQGMLDDVMAEPDQPAG